MEENKIMSLVDINDFAKVIRDFAYSEEFDRIFNSTVFAKEGPAADPKEAMRTGFILSASVGLAKCDLIYASTQPPAPVEEKTEETPVTEGEEVE